MQHEPTAPSAPMWRATRERIERMTLAVNFEQSRRPLVLPHGGVDEPGMKLLQTGEHLFLAKAIPIGAWPPATMN